MEQDDLCIYMLCNSFNQLTIRTVIITFEREISNAEVETCFKNNWSLRLITLRITMQIFSVR